MQHASTERVQIRNNGKPAKDEEKHWLESERKLTKIMIILQRRRERKRWMAPFFLLRHTICGHATEKRASHKWNAINYIYIINSFEFMLWFNHSSVLCLYYGLQLRLTQKKSKRKQNGSKFFPFVVRRLERTQFQVHFGVRKEKKLLKYSFSRFGINKCRKQTPDAATISFFLLITTDYIILGWREPLALRLYKREAKCGERERKKSQRNVERVCWRCCQSYLLFDSFIEKSCKLQMLEIFFSFAFFCLFVIER